MLSDTDNMRGALGASEEPYAIILYASLGAGKKEGIVCKLFIVF